MKGRFSEHFERKEAKGWGRPVTHPSHVGQSAPSGRRGQRWALLIFDIQMRAR